MNEAATGNFLMALVAAIATWAGVEQSAITALAALLVVDYITGIGRSLAVGRAITSRYGLIGIISKLSMLAIPLTIGLIAQGVGFNMGAFVQWSINLLVINEGYSAISNIYTIKNKKELPEWSVIEIMLGKLQSIAKGMIEK